MEIYLVVITTALVATQVIRLVQNTKQLRILKKKALQEQAIVEKWEKMASAIDKLAERVE